MPLISLLVIVLIACVVLWAAKRLMGAFAIGEPIATVIYVLVALVVLAYFLNQFGVPLRLR